MEIRKEETEKSKTDKKTITNHRTGAILQTSNQDEIAQEKVATVWSLVNAVDMGLVSKECSLKDITITSSWDEDSVQKEIESTDAEPAESQSFETNVDKDQLISDHLNMTWPFVKRERITLKVKRVRKRGKKKKKWIIKQQRKPKRSVCKTVDAEEEEEEEEEGEEEEEEEEEDAIKDSRKVGRVPPLPIASTDNVNASPRLSWNNFSLTSQTQLHVRSPERDERKNRERSSKSSPKSTDAEDEKNQRTTSRMKSNEIPRIDYSQLGYAKYFTSAGRRQVATNQRTRQSRTKRSKYRRNIKNVDNNGHLRNYEHRASKDTTSGQNNISTNDERTAKFATTSKRPTRKVSTRLSWRYRDMYSSSATENSRRTKSASTVLEKNKRTGKRRGRRKKESEIEDTSANDNYNSHRRSRNLRKSSRDTRGNDVIGDACDDATKAIVQKDSDFNAENECSKDNSTAQRRKFKFLWNKIARSILRDIYANINKDEVLKAIMKDFDDDDKEPSEESSSQTTAENQDNNLQENLDENFILYAPTLFDWESNNDLDKANSSIQDSKQSSEPSAVEAKNDLPTAKDASHKKKLNGSSIDCKVAGKTTTAYQHVFDEYSDFDSPRSSLKISVDENCRQNDNDDNADDGIPSWRRSSIAEICDNESDSSALILARKIIDSSLSEDENSNNDEDKDDEITNSTTDRSEDTDSSFSDKFSDTDGEKWSSVIKRRQRRSRRSTVTRSATKDDRSGAKVQSSIRRRRSRKDHDGEANSTRGKKDDSELSSKQVVEKDNDSGEDSDKRVYSLRRVTRTVTKTAVPKKQYPVGRLVWGSCQGWWPALIIDAGHVGMHTSPGKFWVFWIGESQISSLNEKTQIQPFSCKLEQRLTQQFRKDKERSRAIDATIQMLRQHFESPLTKPYYDWILRNVSRLERLDDLTFYPYPKYVQEKLDILKEKNAKTTQKYVSKQTSSTESSPPRKKTNTEKQKEMKDEKPGWKEIEAERLPLQYQNPGVIAWAKIAGHSWWPAMIIDYRDCSLKEPSFGCQWIMWYGDYKISEVRHLEFLKFHKGLEKMTNHIKTTVKPSYREGVLQAAKDYCSRLGCNTDNWTLDNVFEYFSNENIRVPCNELQVSDSKKVYDKYSDVIVKQINELKSKPDIDDDRKNEIKTSDAWRRVAAGEVAIEKICLRCLKFFKSKMDEHPFFVGSLCRECSDEFKPCMFIVGNDGKCFYCTICASTGTVIMCDREECPRVYCTACLKYLLCPKTYDKMLLEDPWHCFLCTEKSEHLAKGVLRPRLDWKTKFIGMFRTASATNSDVDIPDSPEKRPIRVLSLFDGLSTGLLVLLKLGLEVEAYYASEIDNDALMVSSSHFGDRITYLGDVRGITREKIQEIAPIDLLIGGSPCNDLSLVNPARLGLHNPKGTGVLFFEYKRIRKLIKKYNKDRHMFWLFENVASMPTQFRLEINRHLGQEPDVIDSADFSPQHRIRLYWHNLPFNPYMPLFHRQQNVQDVLTKNCHRHALVKKLRTVTTRSNSLKQGKGEWKPIIMNGQSDSIWITELEEIFGFPRHYTDVKNLSATSRQKLIGKSWSVQTLIAILRPLCSYFKCNETEMSLSTEKEDTLTS
ncbi:uncharacterized protein LOC109858126 isoform X2 [Pseudomyrmex gracilis]|uniref:uncharacterized protein LOC109858126 isoform X2 n=1 Tax=Pseudomyrmex gracilis TaxID=219809 RepID=UPI0009955F56|nr:uncharacterized protein LOC109858126 isoform X2 [Pseudomyrmex gracilis]